MVWSGRSIWRLSRDLLGRVNALRQSIISRPHGQAHNSILLAEEVLVSHSSRKWTGQAAPKSNRKRYNVVNLGNVRREGYFETARRRRRGVLLFCDPFKWLVCRNNICSSAAGYVSLLWAALCRFHPYLHFIVPVAQFGCNSDRSIGLLESSLNL